MCSCINQLLVLLIAKLLKVELGAASRLNKWSSLGNRWPSSSQCGARVAHLEHKCGAGRCFEVRLVDVEPRYKAQVPKLVCN